MREGTSLFQHKTSTDVTRLKISSASSAAVRFICASWQISHHFQSKLFSCGPISITISLQRVWGIFHWKKMIYHDMRKNISQRNAVLWLCFLCFSTTASETEATCLLTGEKKKKKGHQTSRKNSKTFIPITVSSSSIFYLFFYSLWSLRDLDSPWLDAQPCNELTDVLRRKLLHLLQIMQSLFYLSLLSSVWIPPYSLW